MTEMNARESDTQSVNSMLRRRPRPCQEMGPGWARVGASGSWPPGPCRAGDGGVDIVPDARL